MITNVYIDLPKQDPRSGDGRVFGKIDGTMYGARDAPQIWAETVMNDMEYEGCVSSEFYLRCQTFVSGEIRGGSHNALNRHRRGPSCRELVVDVVDHLLCIGKAEDLKWLYTV